MVLGGNRLALQAVLTLNAKDFESGLKSSGNKLTQFSNRLSAMRGPLLAISGALGGLGVLSVKAAADFETAFAGVRKTVDATEEQFSALSSGIRAMALELPAGTTEIAAVAEAAGQLGIQTDAILGFTRTMIDLGNTTNISATDAATALARLANITQLPQDQFDRLGSTIVDLGNNLATTESEIIDMALRLAGAGKQVGLTQAQILSFSAALSSVGIAAESGGTAFSRVFVEIQNAAATGGEKLEAFAAVAGMTGEQFRQSFEQDAARAVVSFTQGLGELSQQGVNIFPILDDLSVGNIRVRDALLRAANAGDLFTKALDLGSEAWNENTALIDEAEKRYGTVASQLTVAKNTFNELKIQIGNELLPVLVKFLDIGTKLLKWFSDLPEPVRQFGVILGAVVFSMAALGLAIPPVIALMTTLGVTTNIALAGIPLIIAGIVSGIAFMILKWDEFVEFMKGAGGWILAVFGPVGLAAKIVIDNWDLVKEALRSAYNFILDMVDGTIESFNNVIRAVNKVGQIFGKTIPEIEVHLKRWEKSSGDVADAQGDVEAAVASAANEANYAVPAIDELTESFYGLANGTNESTDALDRHHGRLLSLSDEEAAAIGQLVTKRIVQHKLEQDAIAETVKAEEDAANRKIAAEEAYTSSVEAEAKERDKIRNDELNALNQLISSLPSVVGPGVSAPSEVASIRRSLSGTSAEQARRRAEQDADAMGLTGEEREKFIQGRVDAYGRLTGALGGNMALPTLPGMTAPDIPMGNTPATVNVTVNGDIHRDDVSRVAEAVTDAIRTGQLAAVPVM